jgi:uncharacterized cupin superfamily protein
MTDTPDPNFRPINIANVSETTFGHENRFGMRYRHLTKAVCGDNYRVGVAVEVLDPGLQTVPFHYHMLEEEHLFILEGEVTLRLGDERLPMKPGDYAIFPAGRKVGHCLINESAAPCRYIVIGERNTNDVCVYPDSGNLRVRWLDQGFDMRAKRGYFDGE